MQKAKPIFVFIGVLYLILFIDWLLPISINAFGIIPRTKIGLIGIFTSPFLHGNLTHLVSNTAPLLIMLMTLVFFYERKSTKVVLSIVLISGVLLWCFGRSANHIGASGLIYGLAGFLVVNGLMERNFKAILISIIVAVIYGGLIFGVLPTNPSISWEGHLFGGIAGITSSYLFSKKGTKLKEHQ